ncbi:MAG: pyridoxal-phosphate dependent enzyme [Thaumarchaeota archaeon]|nr:pyridoxal-phosphate dependent enzyme [Nitrososphaerota archaeon]
MQQSKGRGEIDTDLLHQFEQEIGTKVPHLESAGTETRVVNPTPLIDITDVMMDCAKSVHGLDVPPEGVRIYGKMDSKITGGSVKVRPAVQIIAEAIASGKLRRGQTVFEATSGNFGVALGMVTKLGINVIALVSRKLQEGVLDELRGSGVKTVDLDVDICPAPGMQIDQNLALAKSVAVSVRQQLSEIGLDTATFDESKGEIERLLARQDVINLAKFLAQIYDGFCPQQYDNELNIRAHEVLTGPEIDQQLRTEGYSLGEFGLICAFGTGGTSGGLSKYVQKTYGKKHVRVIFPLGNQDVAGIRTKEKAAGLRLYDPEKYAGEHEVDFEASKPLLGYFVKKGYDLGESSALALYACIQLINYGAGKKFVVIIADGISKYAKNFETKPEAPKRLEVNAQEAAEFGEYKGLIWTHGMFTPNEEGARLIASAVGYPVDKMKVARTRDVQRLVSTQEIPDALKSLLPKDGGRVLLVCMAGQTSLRIAQIFAEKGIAAESLKGGIINVATASRKQPSDLVRMAAE